VPKIRMNVDVSPEMKDVIDELCQLMHIERLREIVAYQFRHETPETLSRDSYWKQFTLKQLAHYIAEGKARA
jgi:hypothetical protein